MDSSTERGSEIKRLNGALHDLCQPLTTLQCRLEMAKMLNTEQDYREAVELALKECERLSNSVTEMRNALRALIEAG